MAESEQTHWWYVARRRLLKAVLASLKFPSNAGLLEVGCGTGGNLALLAQFGDVKAIEMDARAREIAVRAKGAEQAIVRPGRMPDQNPFADEKFDGIFLFDVLEHIDRDFETLRTLRDCLTHDGRIVVTVPAYKWLWGRHDEVLHHHRRYVKGELRDLFHRAGYSVARISYFNTFLFPLVAVTRLWEKAGWNAEVAGQATPPTILNKVLARVFASETRLVLTTGLPFGVSILCIASAQREGEYRKIIA
jgi:SAM-dependent methyltransferase